MSKRYYGILFNDGRDSMRYRGYVIDSNLELEKNNNGEPVGAAIVSRTNVGSFLWTTNINLRHKVRKKNRLDKRKGRLSKRHTKGIVKEFKPQ